MKTYSLSPQGIAKVRRQAIQRMSILLGLVCCGGIAISLRDTTNWPITLLVAIVVSIGVMAFGLALFLEQDKGIVESMRIELAEDYIRQTQVRIPQIRIRRQEITAIEEIEGGLYIRTADPARTLAIPNALAENDFHEIKNKLAAWRTIQSKSPKVRSRDIVLFVCLLVGFGILLLSSSLEVVLITGVLMTGYYGYTYFSLRNTEGVDPQLKRSLLFAVVFSAFITAMKAWVLSGGFDAWLHRLTQAR